MELASPKSKETASISMGKNMLDIAGQSIPLRDIKKLALNPKVCKNI